MKTPLLFGSLAVGLLLADASAETNTLAASPAPTLASVTSVSKSSGILAAMTKKETFPFQDGPVRVWTNTVPERHGYIEVETLMLIVRPHEPTAHAVSTNTVPKPAMKEVMRPIGSPEFKEKNPDFWEETESIFGNGSRLAIGPLPTHTESPAFGFVWKIPVGKKPKQE